MCVILSVTKLTTNLRQWIPTKFDPDVEAVRLCYLTNQHKVPNLYYFQVYEDLCAPFHLERSDFAQVLLCMREIKIIKAGNDYVTEKMSPVDSLSMVLSGR